MKPRLLDLFCGAGGAGYGYHLAGFDVVGVDTHPQPRYPFAFVQADALTFPLDGFDAVHASPPCQAYSAARTMHNARHDHPDLVEPVRDRLMASGLPWVMENVPGAPLAAHVILCGSMFGLTADGFGLRRHRLFETSMSYLMTSPCVHDRPALGVYGNGGTGRSGAHGTKATIRQAKQLMGIEWMTTAEICLAIPPAYTHFLGEQLLAVAREAAA